MELFGALNYCIVILVTIAEAFHYSYKVFYKSIVGQSSAFNLFPQLNTSNLAIFLEQESSVL